MQDVMIDIETLDTRPSAVVLSIGAVRFDVATRGALGEKIHLYIDIDDSVRHGRTISGSTFQWWLGQPAAARERILTADPLKLPIAMGELAQFIGPKDRVWGNGAAFDNVILADCFRSAGMDAPWRFWNDYCYRTVKNLYKHVPKPEFVGVKHDALDDAINQAWHLQHIYEAGFKP